MKNGIDYLFFDDVKMLTSKSALKQYEAVMLATKNYVFVIPKQTVGFYMILQTFTNHRYFANSSVVEGCQKLISEASSLSELEQTFIELLENDDKLVSKLSEIKQLKLNKWFSTFNFRMIRGNLGYTAVVVKGKEKGNLIKSFFSL